MILDIEISSRPKAGELVSGDAALHRRTDGAELVAVIDALGHGPVAHDVAQRALAFLHAASLAEGVAALMNGLHQALKESRGAAAALCLLKDGVLEGASVGNVVVRLTGKDVSVVPTPGVLGVRLGTVRVFKGTLRSAQRLCLFSDGVSSRLDLRDVQADPIKGAVRALMDRFAHSHDDATLLLSDIGVTP